jgi:hypothetical protein
MCGCEQTLNDTPSLAMKQTPSVNYKITEFKEIDTNKVGDWFTRNSFIGGLALMGAIAAISYKVIDAKKGEL